MEDKGCCTIAMKGLSSVEAFLCLGPFASDAFSLMDTIISIPNWLVFPSICNSVFCIIPEVMAVKSKRSAAKKGSFKLQQEAQYIRHRVGSRSDLLTIIADAQIIMFTHASIFSIKLITLLCFSGFSWAQLRYLLRRLQINLNRNKSNQTLILMRREYRKLLQPFHVILSRKSGGGDTCAAKGVDHERCIVVLKTCYIIAGEICMSQWKIIKTVMALEKRCISS